MVKWPHTTFLSVLLTWCCVGLASASLGYSEIPEKSNAISYDYKLLNIVKKEGMLWRQPFLPTVPPGSKTYVDALASHNLSYTLEAYTSEDNNFILPLLNRSILYHYIGNQERSFTYLLNAKAVMDSMNQKGFSLGTEKSKIFKGESYEQAMACLYMGFLSYTRKDYQNARALFSQAIELDREIIPDAERLEKIAKKYASKQNGVDAGDILKMYQAYGNDNRLAYYMLARTYQKLNDEQNVRISLANTDNWESVPDYFKKTSCGNYVSTVNCYDTAPSPNNPFTEQETFEKANTIILVQLGVAPEKRLGGYDGNKDMLSIPTYQPRKAEVYVDGKYIATAFPMLNLMHQAACLPRSAKDSSQTGKAILKGGLSFLAAVVSEDLGQAVQNNWSVAADTRRWGTLPNEIHMVSADLPEGLHTISVVFYDAAGSRLRHFEQIHHFVPVRENEETFLMVRALYDKFNTMDPFYASEVTVKDVKTGLVQFNPSDIDGVQVGQELDIFSASYEAESSLEATTSMLSSATKLQRKFVTEAADGPRIHIKRLGTVKVTKVSSNTKAEGQLSDGSPQADATYYVTKNTMAKEDILELDNTYEKVSDNNNIAER